jgi:hypothetical protein
MRLPSTAMAWLLLLSAEDHLGVVDRPREPSAAGREFSDLEEFG